MTESVSFLGLVTALFLPWVMGAAWARLLLSLSLQAQPLSSFSSSITLVLGYGYLLGVLLLTLLMRLWAISGLSQSFVGIAAGVAVLTVIPVVLQLSQFRAMAPAGGGVTSLTVLARVVIAILALLILWRLVTLYQEIMLRPLFPWDAWMNWDPKAMVWYHFGELTPWVSPSDWLKSESLVYTAGAGNAWRYPETVPLLQLWMKLGAGTAEAPALQLPWLLALISLGLVVFGHVRLLTASTAASCVAAYLVLSLPYLNVHTALGGYSDLWVAAAFTGGALALNVFHNTRSLGWLALAAAMAVLCMTLKIPGLVLGGLLLGLAVLSATGISTKLLVGLAGIAGVLAAAVLVIGVDITMPGIGRLEISADQIDVPYIGRYSLNVHPVGAAFVETLLEMIQWNLMWYLVAVMLVVVIVTRQWPVDSLYLSMASWLGLAFIVAVYVFTDRYRFALDFTQVNRALIYVVPALLVTSLLAFWRVSTGAPDLVRPTS
ncbi:hypothetical protein [Parahalioglobus pacificus]|uniref:Uncharacterized protein n=1 Tax=Parahalioglobus pacificus TaxID=930806 RepID=A0A918XIS6_9GAMM|nr:hypothetical protein [Halioglobus pacificus]GHD33774.1 hypothetical protein GCM10007053_18660 [Halioglobus pacificus]